MRGSWGNGYAKLKTTINLLQWQGCEFGAMALQNSTMHTYWSFHLIFSPFQLQPRHHICYQIYGLLNWLTIISCLNGSPAERICFNELQFFRAFSASECISFLWDQSILIRSTGFLQDWLGAVLAAHKRSRSRLRNKAIGESCVEIKVRSEWNRSHPPGTLHSITLFPFQLRPLENEAHQLSVGDCHQE